ncbi:MAG TPA: YeiH family putative sulfate export transporter, partial [Xanthomonadaceae bacterium]|nr:YeiH family putative sulfate export transporter [Xanthomonadaceae bacterium]
MPGTAPLLQVDSALPPLARFRTLLPGLLLTAVIAASALWLGGHAWLQAKGLGALTLAIVIGIAVGNSVYPAIADAAGAGVGFAKGPLLRAGIVLYGLRLTFQDVAQVGVAGVAIDALVLVSTFSLAWLLGTRLLKMDLRTTLLIGAGSSVCGAAAVMAAEPVVRGRSEQVAVAVSTVVVFGTLAMFAWPALYAFGAGRGWLAADPRLYGIFAGSTVHEVAQVVAAASAAGAAAADAALIAKMVRVMMLAPFLLLLALLLARRARGDAEAPVRIAVPWFAFGFVAVIAVHSLVPLTARWAQATTTLDTALLAAAMAGLGLTTRAGALRDR